MSDPLPPLPPADDGASIGDLRPLPVGRYRDFLPVGEGGMGIVYWAMDTELPRQVAIKIVRPPSASGGEGVTPPLPMAIRGPKEGERKELDEAFEQLKARFLQEAWVTGAMEHPGIVPVYELGRTDAGVPYYTMRFVRGSRTLKTAIAELADAPFEDRLALLEPFLKICDTIRYAHSRGVIHRDLKPDNIALGEFGEVVVLDWGLAKLTGEEPKGEGRWQSKLEDYREARGLETIASAVGTPGYMSPEAALGETARLDQRSDVYSLGVMLVEILTGRPPFTYRSLAEYREQVVARDSPKADSLCADVPQPLVALCRDALAREPDERPASVDELAQRLRGWRVERAQQREIEGLLTEADAALSSMPDLQGAALLRQVDRATAAARRVLVLEKEHAGARSRIAEAEAARERGIAEREQAARQRTLRRAAGIGLTIATLAAGAVALVLKDKRDEADRARAVAERARSAASSARGQAEGVMGFMVGEMLDSLEPIGRLELLARVGEEARTYYENLPPEARTPTSLRNGAHALRSLGNVYYEQGDLPAAKDAYLMSRGLAESLLTRPEHREDAALLVSEARAHLGRVLMAQGYPNRAVAWLKAHLEEISTRRENESAAPRFDAAIGEAHYLLSRALGQVFEVERSLDHALAALESAEARSREHDPDGDAARDVVRYLMAPLGMLRLRGRLREAAARATRALALVEQGRSQYPQDLRWAELEARVLLERGRIAQGDDRLKDAKAMFDRGATAIEELRSADPHNYTYLALDSILRHQHGYVLRAEALREGTPAAKVTTHHAPWREAYEIRKRLLKRDPSNGLWMHAMIGLCDRMAQVELETTGDMQRAESYREEALSWARKLVACDEQNTLWSHLLAYTLHKHAGRRRHLAPRRSHTNQLEVMQICARLAPRYPDGLIEVAVLNAWAAGALLPEAMTPEERVGHLRDAKELLQMTQAAHPQSLDVILTLLQLHEQLATAHLATQQETEARRELEEAGKLMEAGRALSGLDASELARFEPIAARLESVATRLKAR